MNQELKNIDENQKKKKSKNQKRVCIIINILSTFLS